MTAKRDPLTVRARRRLFGKRVVGLSPEQVTANVRLGADAEDRAEWPLSVVDTNQVARALNAASRCTGTDRKEQQ